MTGALADAWDIQKFPVSGPFQTTARAALAHDIGWIDWEGNPKLDPDTGHPCDFLAMPKEAHLGIWESGFNDAVTLNPLTGLLVLRHNMALAGKDDAAGLSAGLRNKLDEFKTSMEAADAKIEQALLNHSSYRGMLTSHDLREMNRFVLFIDYLSLRMCMGHERENPFGPPPAAAETSFTMEKVKGERETFILDPWPFRDDTFTWPCTAWLHTANRPFSQLGENDKRTIELKLLPAS